jgi:uncharacterized damage-inducible protein DinB
MRPQPGDYAPYYETYIELVQGDDVLAALENNYITTQQFLKSIPEEKGDYRYASGKWSVKQVIMHMSDTERVFAYRALSIARGDSTPLPGYDENSWAENHASEKRTLTGVVEEFLSLRQSTIPLVKSFDEKMFGRKGTANNNPASVAALVYIIAGHELHHLNVLRERYGL